MQLKFIFTSLLASAVVMGISCQNNANSNSQLTTAGWTASCDGKSITIIAQTPSEQSAPFSCSNGNVTLQQSPLTCMQGTLTLSDATCQTILQRIQKSDSTAGGGNGVTGTYNSCTASCSSRS